VYVEGRVSSARRAEVMVVAEERVERLMVLEPITTRLLAVPVRVRTTPPGFEADCLGEEDAGRRVEVAMLEVIVEPAELVVVTAMVVGSSVELGESEETSEEVETAPAAAAGDESEMVKADEIEAVDEGGTVDDGPADVFESLLVALEVVTGAIGVSLGVEVDIGAVEEAEGVDVVVIGMVDVGLFVDVADGDTVLELVLTIVVDDVLSITLVVVTPVATICLFGMMPRGISSALIVAKPNPSPRRASMMADRFRR